jgi:hypothetical protein
VLVLQPCAQSVEPWAGLVSGPRSEVRRSSRAAHASSAVRRGARLLPTPTKYGFNWIWPEVRRLEGTLCALTATPGSLQAAAAVRAHQGGLWVAQYLLAVWEADLAARLQVRPRAARLFAAARRCVACNA